MEIRSPGCLMRQNRLRCDGRCRSKGKVAEVGECHHILRSPLYQATTAFERALLEPQHIHGDVLVLDPIAAQEGPDALEDYR